MSLRYARRSVTVLLTALLALASVALLAGPADASFEDTRGSVYEEAVTALTERGVINGCGDGDAFCPNDRIRRDQLASLLDRALGLPDAGSSPAFGDISGSVHAESIERVAAAGITDGCAAGAFCPANTTRRGQMASLLDAAFDLPATSTVYFADTGYHAAAIDRAAAAGLTDGCSASPTSFCPRSSLNRGQAALFLARAFDLVDRVEPRSLDDREAEVAAAASTNRHPDQVWDDLAQCESGGNWSINTGNGYYGGLQFLPETWRSVGGTGLPHEHTREEQIRRGEILQERSGWGQWPSCSRQLGLR